MTNASRKKQNICPLYRNSQPSSVPLARQVCIKAHHQCLTTLLMRAKCLANIQTFKLRISDKDARR
eukprot:2753347-Amphidinium_carterae.1